MKRYLDQQQHVFEPVTIRVLTGALDDAWLTVQTSGATYAEDGLTETVREILAKHIIAAARYGELDQHQLSRSAVAHLITLFSRTPPAGDT